MFCAGGVANGQCPSNRQVQSPWKLAKMRLNPPFHKQKCSLSPKRSIEKWDIPETTGKPSRVFVADPPPGHPGWLRFVGSSPQPPSPCSRDPWLQVYCLGCFGPDLSIEMSAKASINKTPCCFCVVASFSHPTQRRKDAKKQNLNN